ncbi:MAG TPA: CBS domain-containing protein [Myxococcota bacterium]|nr:CBS domain-containing protein [Myxococcota bacterium]
MSVARDVIDPDALVVGPDERVVDLARRLYETRADGACVVDGGRVVGVVTTMDVLFRARRLHTPPVFVLMDLVIPLGNPWAMQRERDKVVAATVAGLMTRDPVTVGPDEPLDAVASRMIDEHLSLVPVVEDGRLLGVVTKHGALGAILPHA